jgi:hypothetical protein
MLTLVFIFMYFVYSIVPSINNLLIHTSFSFPVLNDRMISKHSMNKDIEENCCSPTCGAILQFVSWD